MPPINPLCLQIVTTKMEGPDYPIRGKGLLTISTLEKAGFTPLLIFDSYFSGRLVIFFTLKHFL